VRFLAVALAALGLAPAHVQRPVPARLQVVANEFSFSLSRQQIPAGPVVIELVNFGMDPHDLRLQRIGGKRVYAIGLTQPGERGELDATLLAGRYRLWCAVDHHSAHGMRASLRVVPRKQLVKR
jgi:hypothetical protein